MSARLVFHADGLGLRVGGSGREAGGGSWRGCRESAAQESLGHPDENPKREELGWTYPSHSLTQTALKLDRGLNIRVKL